MKPFGYLKDRLKYWGVRFAGWIAYADIEWLFVSTVFEEGIYSKQTRNSLLMKTGILTIEPDILALKSLIDGLGKLTYDLDDYGLKLYGYR